MKQQNPLKSFSQPKSIILSGSSQLIGRREKQEDYFSSYSDECFVLADGVGGMSHGGVAAKHAVESAIWGYKLIRQRQSYWQNKKEFIARIFRAVNISVFQKRKEREFADGLATTLVVLIMGDRIFWLGSVGDSSAFLYRDGSLTKLTIDDVDGQGYLTKTIGTSRYGLRPQYISDRSLPDDVMLLATDGITNFVPVEDLEEILHQSGSTKTSIEESAQNICTTAQKNGCTDNMTTTIIKRISLARVK